MTYYSQLDPQWSKKYIGKTKQTIGAYGCTITSLCNLLNTIGYNETPDTVNQKLTPVGGFLVADGKPTALLIWSTVSKVWPKLQFVKRVRNYNNVEVAWWVYGKKTPVMVEVYNKLSPTRLHWVLFIGNRKLVDPLGGVIKPTSTFDTLTGYTLYNKI